MEGELWIFGYGSLVFRPGFAFEGSEPARLAGFARRFWQGSTDHRGVPGAPGRVVTLVAEAGASCWGVAYRVAAERRAEVLRALDGRERGGYRRLRVRPVTRDGRRLAAVTYRALPGNPNYLGPAPLPAIAAQVREAGGPSGPNRDYVLRLAQALRSLGAADEHVFALEALLGGPARGGEGPRPRVQDRRSSRGPRSAKRPS